jgi:hypothetical protein
MPPSWEFRTKADIDKVRVTRTQSDLIRMEVVCPYSDFPKSNLYPPKHGRPPLPNQLPHVLYRKKKPNHLPSPFPYTLSDLALLLRASLYEYRPRLRIHYHKRRKLRNTEKGKHVEFGRLVSYMAHESDEPEGDTCLTLYLKVGPRCKWPKSTKILHRVNLTIACPLLPRSLYQYGVCDTLRGRYRTCSDIQYLKRPGRALVPDVGPSRDRTRCAVFWMRTGNLPKSYCKFDFQ